MERKRVVRTEDQPSSSWLFRNLSKGVSVAVFIIVALIEYLSYLTAARSKPVTLAATLAGLKPPPGSGSLCHDGKRSHSATSEPRSGRSCEWNSQLPGVWTFQIIC